LGVDAPDVDICGVDDPDRDDFGVAEPFVDELGVVDPLTEELFVVEPGKENPPIATVRTNGFAGLARKIGARAAGITLSAHSVIVTRLRRK
jgi:hypothetical protein